MVDVETQVGAVGRALERQGGDGDQVMVQQLAQTYPASLDETWSAVTEADRIARWFLPVTGDLEPGGRYQLEGNAGGEVLECEPPSGDSAGFRVTWEMMGAVSWVRVRLVGEGTTTRLVMEHSVRVADQDVEFWDTYGPGATGVGWDGALLGLALHLGATEGSLSPADAAAWAGTDEGRSFYRASADAWADADLAFGTDGDAARRRADTTYAFYTGG